MSVIFTSRVWDNSKQRGTDKLMLLAIADSANKDTGIAWPGMGTLAKMMGPKYSRRAAGQRVEFLARSGELAVFPRKGGSHDYIVVLGMSRAELKAAYRKLAARRHVKISTLIDLRRSFAGRKTGTCEEVSQVPAKPTSQGVRSPLRTNRKEPLSEPVVTTTTSIFAVWEQEAKTPLSPFLHDELGDMVDKFGETMAADAIKEAVKSTGPGQFNIKYVWRILERWQREGKVERKSAPGGSKPAEPKLNHPPKFVAQPREVCPPARALEILLETQKAMRAK